jgi:prepilin-type N-terminal cleavage/methylation domain-containing protein
VSRDRSDSGFTLIEVTLATVITGIIVGALATALVIMLNSYPSSANRLAQSDNAQLLSSWLVPDVQSASGGDGPLAYNTPYPGILIPSPQTQTTAITGCGAPVPPSASVLKLTWADADYPGTHFIADYRKVGTELVRWYCQNGSSPTPTVVGRDIASAHPIVTMDSVDLNVQTTKAITDTTSCLPRAAPCYRFDVVASRRTPALRIWALPLINDTYATQWSNRQQDIAGTAAPGTISLTLKISDQGTPSHPPIVISNINFDGSTGHWSLLSSSFRQKDLSFCTGVSGPCDLDDMLSSSAFQVFNEALPLTFQIGAIDTNGNQSTATTTTVKDVVPPQPSIWGATVGTPPPAVATPPLPLTFMVQFSKQVTDLSTAPNAVTVTGPNCGSTPPCNSPIATVSKLSNQLFKVQVGGLDTADDRGDGNVTVTVNRNVVTDPLSGNGNTQASFNFAWDANTAPTVSGDAFPTGDATIQYLVAFPPLAAGTQLVPADFTATPSTVVPSSPQPAPCLPNTPSGYRCFNVSVPVSGSVSNGQQVKLIFNGGTTANVLDQWGQPIPASVTAATVIWTNAPLTIVPQTTKGSGNVTFTGTAVPGAGNTVSVELCSDLTCSSPQPIGGPPIVVLLDGSWTSTQVPAASGTYWARVTQTQVGTSNTVMTGPFTT